MANQVLVTVSQKSLSTSVVAARHHHVLVDRPLEKDGEDQGPMGGELFLAGLGGCFMSNLLAAINARNAEVTDIDVEVIGTLSEAPVRFSDIEMSVNARFTDRKLMEKLITIAERGCLVFNTLKDAVNLKCSIVQDSPAGE